MNILYHHRTRGEAVEGVHIRGMVKALKKLGNDVDLLSPPGADPMKNFACYHPNDIELRKIFFKRLWRYISFRFSEGCFEMLEFLYNFFGVFRMFKLARRKRIDLIYERYALNCFAGVVTAKRYNIPIILEINDSAFVERVRNLKFKALARATERLIFKRADALVTISNRFKDIICKTSGISPKDVYVIPNACDGEVFDPKKYDGQIIRRRYEIGDRLVVGYIGSFAYWHGLRLLVKAIDKLCRDNKKFHFLLIGEGRDLPSIRAETESLGLTKNVTFTGKVPHSEIAGYISAMDIGLIPASNDYGSPMKLFEYMAMAIVPVALRLGPVEEIINDGVDGVLFKPNDADDLADKLRRLAADGKERQTIGSNARNKFLQHHRWQDNAKKVLGIYKKIKDKK